MGHKVPLLLESFPVPPSFIPPSSATSPYFNQSSVSGHSNEGSSPKSTTPPLSSAPSNPPPSLPPSGPLPPVPGRSRISEHDAAFFLQSSRNSRHSTHSSHSNSSRPDSVASFASARSNGASYAYGKRITPEVQVDDTDDTSQAYGGLEDPVQLTSLRISPMPPSPTGSDEHEIPTSLSSQFPTPPPLSPFAYQQANAMRRSAQWSAPPSPLSPARRPASPNDSLAEISMHDLPSADEGAESEWDVPTTRPITLKPLDIRHAPSSFTAPIPSRSESRSSLKRMSRISVDNVDSVSLRAAIAPSPDPPLLTPSPNPSTPPLTASSSTFSAPDSDDVDPHRELHRELRSARSRSRSHRERLGLSPTSTPPITSTEFNWPPMPPIPSVTTAPNTSAMSVSESRTTGSDDGGRTSPDIQRLLENTPRPRRSQSRKRRSSTGTSRRSSTNTKASLRRRKSDYAGSEDEWDEFGAHGGGRGRKSSERHLVHNHESVEERLRKLERELDGIGSDSESDESRHRRSYGDGFGFGVQGENEALDIDSDASDSSLDLHTPLPNLMLRHGLLSPNSKLLPASASTSVDSLASLVTNGLTADRPGSTMSMISNASSIQTRSGLLKDTRDTSSRRLRHKDGRLLKGGIGLTTGLGWSDSEDEGAPSPLTRRLSTLNLSRKSSSVSLRSQRERSKSYGNLRPSNSMSSVSRPSTLSSSTRSSTFSYGSRSYNPLSRSYSSTLDTELDEVDEVNEFGEIHLNKDKEKGKNAPPPTSWSGKRSIGRIGIKSSGSSSSTLSLNTSVSKSGDKTPKTLGKSRIVRSGSEASIYSSASEAAGHTSRYGYGADEYATLTPSSTASSVSIPLPVTPRDGDDALITPTPSLIDEARFLNTNKGLPSLPNPITGSIRRPSAPPSLKKSNLRKRSMSSSSSGHPTGIPSKGSDTSHIPSVPSVPSSSSLMTMSMSSKSRTSPALSSSSSPQPPRQLQLPRQTVTNTNGQVPVPVPSFSGTRSRMRLPSTPSALPSHHAHPLPQPTTPLSPTDPTSTGVPRKSRVGTGMAYRSSPSTNSGMRLPSARTPVVGPKF